MGDKTGIEWTDATWNPTTGCDKVSPGCDNCYALSMAKRLKGMGSAKYQTDGDPATSGPGFGFAMHPSALDQPLRWTRPRRIFVNSMSDLFHSSATQEFVARVFAVMYLTPRHTYQVLTKRPGVMRSWLTSPRFRDHVANHAFLIGGVRAVSDGVPWPLPNVWLGTSVEDQKRADLRIPALLDTPAAVRFLSCEPLLGPVDLVPPLRTWAEGRAVQINTHLHWVIAGGESGRNARPMHPSWVRSLRDQCVSAEVPFHFKQWGEWAPGGYESGTHLIQVTGQAITRESGTVQNPYGYDSGSQDLVVRGHPGWVRIWRPGKHSAGRTLDGRTWDESPEEVESDG